MTAAGSALRKSLIPPFVLGLARYLWHSPHGLDRLVDATGTHELDTAQAPELAHPGALHAALGRVEPSLSWRHRSSSS